MGDGDRDLAYQLWTTERDGDPLWRRSGSVQPQCYRCVKMLRLCGRRRDRETMGVAELIRSLAQRVGVEADQHPGLFQSRHDFQRWPNASAAPALRVVLVDRLVGVPSGLRK